MFKESNTGFYSLNKLAERSIKTEMIEPKLPEGISDIHHQIAKTIKGLCNLPPKSESLGEKYDLVTDQINKLGFDVGNDKKILLALESLGADEYTKSEAISLYYQERGIFLEDKRTQDEKRESDLLWEERNREQDSEFEELLKRLEKEP